MERQVKKQSPKNNRCNRDEFHLFSRELEFFRKKSHNFVTTWT